MPSSKKTPLVLMILDGWGYREQSEHNAIAFAKTPHMDRLWRAHPHSLLSGSGVDVGLPEGQMGNSEVGHLCLGSGRVVEQSLARINQAIQEDDFNQNAAYLKTLQDTHRQQGALHLMGLLSPGGVHAHEDQINAAIKTAHEQGLTKIYLHAFLDGRDTPPSSATASLKKTEALFKTLKCGQIASIIGRYYAMDRDNRWARIEQAYRLIVAGEAISSHASALDALNAAYEANESDEFVQARSITNASGATIQLQENDSLVFMNFRSDRARQLTATFVDPNFSAWQTTHPQLTHFLTLTHYADDLQAPCMFPPNTIRNGLGEVLAHAGKTQLRISETEKYAHVTFFFNGGIETPFANESRILVPSPQVASYDLKPEMSSVELTQKLVQAIESQSFDVIVCNYPNGDMVGHTGNFKAAVAACEAVDHAVGQVVAALQKVAGQAIITADHGNVECMRKSGSEQAHTAHTSEPVPCIYVGDQAQAQAHGTLADIAPTILSLLKLKIPPEMTGSNLFKIIT
jgi:2,3-bisphosphoglycerate-independent phosphoglycerate mutase